MSQKKILIPLGVSEKGLKSVHHGIALAKRLNARVYILQQISPHHSTDPLEVYLKEALLDLINNARQEGLTLSHHIAGRNMKDEILNMVKEEGINLLVFEADDDIAKHLLFQIKPLIASQIIQVSEKGYVHSGGREEKPGAIDIQHL